MRYVSSKNRDSRHQRQRARSGFTLVEILVALAIFTLMLTIILVPINLSIDLLSLGKARAEVQQASQATLDDMQRELRRAIFVFPNAELPGVTDRAPYGGAPYFNSNRDFIDQGYVNASASGSGACTPVRTDNVARIDFLLSRKDNNAVVSPLEPEYYLVSYYARRLNMALDYEPFRNPVVLFRAQIPYRLPDGSDFFAPDGSTASGTTAALNADLSNGRYPTPAACGTAGGKENRESMWLTESKYGEANLEPLTVQDATIPGETVVASHTLLTPRGMRLVPSPDAPPSPYYYAPTTTFTCQDTNGDHKIDRVTILLELGQYDETGADTRGTDTRDQRVRFPKVVDLPNVK